MKRRAYLCVAAIALSGCAKKSAPGSAGTTPEQEPNDTPATAQSISALPFAGAGSLAAPSTTGDADWYRFAGTAGQFVSITMTSAGASAIQPAFELVAAPGDAGTPDRAFARAASSTGLEAAATVLLPYSGDYLVVASDSRNAGAAPVGGAGFDYVLRIEGAAPPETASSALVSGTPVGVGLNGIPAIYGFSMATAGTLLVDARAKTGEIGVTVRDADGGAIAAHAEGSAPVLSVALAAGDYQIGVESVSSSGADGGYWAQATLAVFAAGADVPEAEPNDSMATASPGDASSPTLTASQAVSFSGTTDSDAGAADYFVFRANSARRITVVASVGVAITLLDADGRTIATGTRANEWDIAAVARDVVIPGTGGSGGPFYVRVAPVSQGAAIPYRVHVFAQLCDESTFGSPAIGGVRYNQLLPRPAGDGGTYTLSAQEVGGSCGDSNGDGVADPVSDQFVELANTGPRPVDLAGLRHQDNGGNSFTFACGTLLWPGQTLRLFGGGPPPDTDAWTAGAFAEVARIAGADQLGLDVSPSEATAEVVSLIAPDGGVIDTARYASEAPVAVSLVRAIDGGGVLQQFAGTRATCRPEGAPPFQWGYAFALRADGTPLASAVDAGGSTCADAPDVSAGGLAQGRLDDVDGGGPSCAPFAGKVAVYRATLVAGQTLAVRLGEPASSLGYAAVRRACDQPCVAISGDGGTAPQGALVFRATESGPHYLIVGSLSDVPLGAYHAWVAVY